ncbi:hypothetical protein ACFL5O_06575 [Myxococcota bacterium]
MPTTPDYWRQCSSCRTHIGFGSSYYACSVSTCNRGRMALYFCSLPCWEAHLPMMRHRDAWAEEQRAPTQQEWECEQVVVSPTELPATPLTTGPRRVAISEPDRDTADDVLVVVAKLKKYIRDHAGLNTSDGVVSVLSDHMRHLCRQASEHASRDGRKTVMDRDFLPFVRSGR